MKTVRPLTRDQRDALLLFLAGCQLAEERLNEFLIDAPDLCLSPFCRASQELCDCVDGLILDAAEVHNGLAYFREQIGRERGVALDGAVLRELRALTPEMPADRAEALGYADIIPAAEAATISAQWPAVVALRWIAVAVAGLGRFVELAPNGRRPRAERAALYAVGYFRTILESQLFGSRIRAEAIDAYVRQRVSWAWDGHREGYQPAGPAQAAQPAVWAGYRR